MNIPISARWAFAAGSLLTAFSVSPVFGIGGVGDVVIIAADQTDMWKWPREQAEWKQVQGLIQTQIKETQLILERLGTPGASAVSGVGDVTRITNSVFKAVALPSVEQALEEGRTEFKVGKSKAPLREADKVSGSFKVLGDSYTREVGRFEPFAEQEALLERQNQAIENQANVVASELDVQRRLLGQLRSATTQADIEVVTAGIAASQQRLEIADRKTGQARDENATFEARLKLEKDRKTEADSEWADKFVEKLRARALTSLHAQQGENS